MSSDASTARISYDIDKTLGIIIEKWQGNITIDDLQQYWRQYLADPDVLALRITLVDLREANILFNGEELWSLVSGLVIPILNGRDWKTAIVVDGPVQFGVSRQYQAFAGIYSTDCIFDDDDEAIRWLRQTNDT